MVDIDQCCQEAPDDYIRRSGNLAKYHMMKTVAENLEDTASEIERLLSDLLMNYSAIYRWNRHDPHGHVTVFSSRGDYAFEPLNDEGRQLQSRVLEEYRRFYALLRILFHEQPQHTIQTLSMADAVLETTIEQQSTWCSTTEKALQTAVDALRSEFGLIRGLYDASGGTTLYVPDTNALLYNPKLETWAFAESPKFTLILLPTVLSELDSHKTNNRNEAVRDKANKLIHQIKEFRRRGKLIDGVVVVKGKISIMTIATEPKTMFFLPWFDPNNNDDRILASTLEVMRRYPKSPVVVVSLDVNLQNKADFARITCIEPPPIP